MNVVKIMGGLGNQLFGYAFSKRLEQQGNVGLDISFFNSPDNHNPKFPVRDFLLDRFAIDYKIAGPNNCTEFINEVDYEPDKEYRDTFFWGYWQKGSLFKDLGLKIRLKDDYISSRAKEIAETMKRQNSVAIHVRRTDYAVFPMWLLDTSYYRLAVDEIRKRVGRPVFYVFSDNIFWAERNLSLNVPVSCVHETDLEDFWLMSQCKHNIIANSTYSFWSAYLNDNPEKLVIYPEDWKCGQEPVDFKDERWISV